MKNDIREIYQQYADILISLARGIDPVTGEKSNSISIQSAEIVRALCAGAVALRTTYPAKESNESKPNAGKHWTPQDDAILMESFDNGEPIELIAHNFGRSALSIFMRLDRLLRKTENETIRDVMQNRKIR